MRDLELSMAIVSCVGEPLLWVFITCLLLDYCRNYFQTIKIICICICPLFCEKLILMVVRNYKQMTINEN
jgi:hypothetical protein